MLAETVPWHLETINWLEEDVQYAFVAGLKAAEGNEIDFSYAASLEGAKRSQRLGSKFKKLGMMRGEADIRIYFKGGQCVFVELKRKQGTVSKVQKERHELLRSLGFTVFVKKYHTPQDAYDGAQSIILELTIDMN